MNLVPNKTDAIETWLYLVSHNVSECTCIVFDRLYVHNFLSGDIVDYAWERGKNTSQRNLWMNVISEIFFLFIQT